MRTHRPREPLPDEKFSNSSIKKTNEFTNPILQPVNNERLLPYEEINIPLQALDNKALKLPFSKLIIQRSDSKYNDSIDVIKNTKQNETQDTVKLEQFEQLPLEKKKIDSNITSTRRPREPLPEEKILDSSMKTSNKPNESIPSQLIIKENDLTKNIIFLSRR